MMGRNLVKFKKDFDGVISYSKVHNRYFNGATTKKVGGLHCFFAFWMD